MKEKLKENCKKLVVKPISTMVSITSAFIRGSITPGIIAFMDKFWFDGMQPNNESGLPILEDSPASVRAFIAGMGIMGVVNVLLEKVYLAKKTQHSAKAKENRHRLNHMRFEIQRCLDLLQKENAILENTTSAQKLIATQMNTFIGLIIQNTDPEVLKPEYLTGLLQKYQKMFNNDFISTYSSLNGLDIKKKYKKPKMVTEFEKELTEVKTDIRAAKNYMFNGFLGWLAIAGLTSFEAVSYFGIPVVFAMTIHALLQDLFELPYGEDIVYAVVFTAFVSCVYNGIDRFFDLLSQKKEENNLLIHSANLYSNCVSALENVMLALQANDSSKKQLRNVLLSSDSLDSGVIAEVPYPFEFKLYRDVQIKKIEQLEYPPVENTKKKDDKEESEQSLLPINNTMSTNYGTNGDRLVTLSKVF